jgi:hypothetical protein
MIPASKRAKTVHALDRSYRDRYEDNTVLGKTFSVAYNNLRNRDSSVGIPMGYEMEGRGSIPITGKRLLYSTASRPVLGPAQPPIRCVPRALSPGVKRQGREAGHSPPSSAQVKDGGAIPPLPNASSCCA